MSLEWSTFIVATLALLGTAWQVKLAYDQRRFAREQAEMRPRLEVSEAKLLELADVDEELEEEVRDIRESRAQRERELAEKERREREREARERRKNQGRSAGLDISKLDREKLEEEGGEGFSLADFLSNLTQPSELARPIEFPTHEFDASSIHGFPTGEPYEGPLPDKVVRIELVNRGRTAAYEITGWIHFDPAHLEPVEEYLDAYDVDEQDDEPSKARVGGGEASYLLPNANDALVFDIAVKVNSPGETRVEYEFTTPQGEDEKGAFGLDV